MNALNTQQAFRSAYRMVSSAERAFIDILVTELEEAARRRGHRISLVLDRPLPQALIDRDTKGFLDRPLVMAAVTERINALAVEQEINPSNWIKEVHALAHSNMDDYFQIDEIGDPVFNLEGLSREKLAAIKSIDIEKSDGLTRSSKTRIKITLHDKVAALKMEAAYMGLDDGDNPHRRTQQAQDAPALPADATSEQAGEAYAQMIGE